MKECVLLLLWVGCAVAEEGFTWKSCANNTVLVVDNITAGPTPVLMNGSGTVGVVLNGSLTGMEPITNGSVEISLNYGTQPIHQVKWSICNASSPLGWSCPKQPGKVSSTSTMDFPKLTLPYKTGTVGGKALVTDQKLFGRVMCPMHLLPIISYLSQYTIIMRVMLLASMLWCVLAADKPHVLLVFADDFGWANVGLHTHDDEVVTPNIDAYAAQGIELDRHYAYKFCSPSRSSLQSGRLPVNVNVENASPTVSNPADPVGGYAGIPVNMTTLAWKMRQAGYRAHMTGKWDAGMATPMHTPIGRGYESWLGYFHHANDYWTEKLPFQSTGTVDVCGNAFVDLWLNNGPALGMNGTVYEEELFTNNTLNIIRQHDPKEPLFLFHAFHLMHTPLQVPQSYLDQFPFIHGSPNQRKPYAAMVKYMDDALGLIVGILKDKAMWDNLLMIFVSDNGGPIYYPGGGNNYPLKGGKMSDWEGGVRVNAFISGGYVPKELQGTKSESYVHVADWYPTLCKLVGVDYYDEAAAKAGLHQVDGVPVLDHFFKKNATVPRTMIHLSDQALIQGEWKVLVGQQVMTGWQGPYYPNATGLQPLYNKDSPVDDWKHECGTGCLYNIIEDPNETNNLALTNGNKLQELTSKLADLNKGNYNPNRGQGDPRACQQAIKYGGFYGPWIDL